MGASATGEIGLLTRIARPTVGVITNAGPAHLAGFGGTVRRRGRGARASCSPASPPGAVAVVNRDDSFHDYWRGTAAGPASTGPSAWRPTRTSAPSTSRRRNGEGLRFRHRVARSGEVAINLPMAGSHNIQNALAAAAATTAAGATLDAVRDGLAGMANVKGRLKPEPGPAGCTIYDDSYNANPGSVAAAIRFLAGLAGQRWFVLGDMAELGPTEVELHREVGRAGRPQRHRPVLRRRPAGAARGGGLRPPGPLGGRRVHAGGGDPAGPVAGRAPARQGLAQRRARTAGQGPQ